MNQYIVPWSQSPNQSILVNLNSFMADSSLYCMADSFCIDLASIAAD